MKTLGEVNFGSVTAQRAARHGAEPRGLLDAVAVSSGARREAFDFVSAPVPTSKWSEPCECGRCVRERPFSLPFSADKPHVA